MKITDIQVVRFRATSRYRPTRWGYSTWGDEHESISSITKIITDEGVVGYNLGGDQATMDGLVKPLLVGENPLDRDKVKAYASSFPNMGQPEDYARHALDCQKQGYKAYKVHAYIYCAPLPQSYP